ncbi:MAG: hypothetical protein AAF915_18695 [Cyanobacteria bacterium P01_D01_bin.50]
MKQLPSENHELQVEVEQLSNIAENAEIDSEMQARIQSLLENIKTSLQQQQLSIEMQRELAKLLSLISKLDDRNPQQIEILDLAISILLESKEDTTKNFQNSNLPNHLSDKNSRNLVFIQEARRQIAIQSREYPHPFSAIIKGTGGAYNRLISGLSWFFLVFVVCPLLGVGLTFVALNILGGRQQAANENRIEKLEVKLENKEKQLKTTSEIRNSLQVRLEKVNRELEKVNLQPKAMAFSTEQNAADSINNQPPVSIDEVQNKVDNLKDNIDNELNSIAEQEKNENNIEELISDIEESKLTSFTKWFVKSDFFFISLAVSMGALGSAVSIIVRANKFIEQSKEGQYDLFFTGFFRPIVGMSFAIFAVALIESGVFSGIFTIAKQENRNVYLYMAIAFIAGFSERLVEDVVLRTEDRLTGYSSRSNKPEK